MTHDVYNYKKDKVGKIDLPENIFNLAWKPSLVHQVVLSQTANKRQTLAHTKGRGDVKGGGKKPWRQKHTGRARASSTRSPLWRGGGITFGPTKEKIFLQKINKKMKQGALFSLLSKKIKDSELFVIDNFNLKDHKTKNAAVLIKNFFQKPVSVLFIPAKENKNAFLAGRNIPKVKILSPESLNVYDGLVHKYVFFEKPAVEQFEKYLKI